MARRKTDAEFRKELHKAQGNAIIPLEKYKGYHTKIKVKCGHCGFVWTVSPDDLFKERGCPHCDLRKKCKTDANFRKKLYKAQGNAIIPLEKYKGSRTKIKVKCHHCGFVWKVRPTSLYEGHGCPRCASHARSVKNGMTNTEFLHKLRSSKSNIIPLEEYKNSKTKILCLCPKCGLKWKITPTTLLRGAKCPRCYRRYIQEHPIYRRRYFLKFSLSNTEFLSRFHKVNKYHITPLQKYKGMQIPILCQCDKCKLKWKISPLKLLSGAGCPKCILRKKYAKMCAANAESSHKLSEVCKNCLYLLKSHKAMYTNLLHRYNENKLKLKKYLKKHAHKASQLSNKDFLHRLHKVWKNTITPLQPYINMDTPILCQCNVCGKVWKATPHHLLQGSGCPKCGHRKTGLKHRSSNTEFLLKLYAKCGSEFTPLKKYQTSNTKIPIKCNTTGRIWYTTPTYILSGRDCPKLICRSHGEYYILKWLRRHSGRSFKYGYIIPSNGLHLDFWIPSIKLAIEFDGGQHFQYIPYFCGHNPKIFKESVHRDKHKNKYCIKHHITLIRIQDYRTSNNYLNLNSSIQSIMSIIQSKLDHHRLSKSIYRFNVRKYGNHKSE